MLSILTKSGSGRDRPLGASDTLICPSSVHARGEITPKLLSSPAATWLVFESLDVPGRGSLSAAV